MPAGLPRPPSIENVSTTLSAGITDVAATMDVADASNLVSPCYLVIDRVDAAGAVKATSLWEYVKVTNIAGSTLTITRGQSGSTAQAHSSGAVVEAVVTSAHFEEWYDSLNPEHTAAGGHVITGTMTVAGMNLASQATIRYGSIGILGVQSAASINQLNVTNLLNASGASLSGIPLSPVFVFIGALSGATTAPLTDLVMPRSGRWQFANFWTRTVASGVSAIVDLNINGGSIFNAVGRPMIAAGGTLVSTASINTKNFFRGDRLSIDYDGTGGHITDFNTMLVSE